MSRELLAADELTNAFIDERVKILIPKFEALAPYKITDRKKGKDDLTGWEQLASQEVRLLKVRYPDDKPEGEKTYPTAYKQSQSLGQIPFRALRGKTDHRFSFGQFDVLFSHTPIT